MPRKIFTVQDEPPTWDDNDDPGMESVSDASSGGRDKDTDGDTISRSDTHDHITLPSPIPIPIPQREETLQDEYTNDMKTKTKTNENAIEIENESRRLENIKQPAIQRAEHGMREDTTTTTRPRPPKPRPLQSMGPVGTDSWIRPVTGGEAAPNGRSVL
jgi:hypothetical protein